MLELILFFIASIMGTLGHYLYNITNNNPIAGFFFAKNESTFEHLKLGITPILFLSIVEKTKLINNNILAIKGIQIFIFSTIIIVFYYLKKLFFKKENAIYNIALFYISLFISYVISFILLNIIDLNIIIRILGILSLCLFISLYFYTALFEPNYLIFKNPLEKKEN